MGYDDKYNNIIKTDFMSRISRDIRTPLNSIMGLTALSQNALNDTEKVKYNLEQISKSCRYILSVVNSVLDMDRIEKGHIELNLCDFDFTKLIDNIEAMMKDKAAEKKQNLIVERGEFATKTVMGDPIRIEQIFTTLLSNSLRFAPEGGNIRLKISETDNGEDSVIIKAVFEDNGAGVPDEFVEHMFEPGAFVTEDGFTSDVETSLNMAITKNLVEMMDGEVASRNIPGRGMLISIGIKLLKADEDLFNDDEEDALSRLQNEDFSGTRALIAEDNELNFLIAKELLEMTGMEVFRAEDGKEACDMFEKATEGFYDVIFMDIQMPVMDGYDATRTIRAMNKADAKDIPIIAMTASAFVSDIVNAKNAGMNEHLAKPVDFDQLCAALNRWIKK